MKNIFLVALNTYKELVRDRTFYVLVFFSIFMIAFSLLLGQLTIQEQLRLTVDFGLTGVQISCVSLAIFCGSTLVFRELEKKTVLYLLAKPLGRDQFLVGKYLGLMAVIFTMVLGLSFVLLSIYFLIDWSWHYTYVVALYGMALESMVLLSIALLLGVLVRPTLVVTISVSMFLLGHWINGFRALVLEGSNVFMHKLSWGMQFVVPNLERFNWRIHVVETREIMISDVLQSTFYALSWCIIYFCITSLIFRRKDFV